MSSPPATGLRIMGLTKRYGAIEAVRGVSLEVLPGEIFGLLGPNGAGKTSTIECILGLLRPDSGTIFANGIDAVANSSQARQFIGAQLQSAALQPKITPRQALGCFAAFYAEPASIDGLLRQFSLTEKANSAFDTLSGGQQQRLFLALALINQPQLLVLDEPTAGLDPQTRHELHTAIRQFRSAGRSILLTTHYLEEAHTLCDRVGILHQGRIVATGTPRELIARSAAKPRISFRTIKPLDATFVGSLPALTDHTKTDDTWVVTTTNVNRTISELVQKLTNEGNEMLDLQIQRPSLEDVFLELTKTTWAASSDD